MTRQQFGTGRAMNNFPATRLGRGRCLGRYRNQTGPRGVFFFLMFFILLVLPGETAKKEWSERKGEQKNEKKKGGTT